MQKFINLYGWYGVIAIVVAYALVSFSIVSPASIVYQVLNATGALGIVVVSFHKKTYQPGALNILWTLIALVAIYRIVFY